MLLHWIIAATILLQIALGWFMASQTDRAVKKQFEAIHISLGLTVLILTVARIVWTLTYPRPTMPSGLKRWEKVLSHTVNGLFYVLMLALPLTGWFMESVGKHPIPFWFSSWPHFPGIGQILAGVADRGAVKDTIERIHGSPLVWIMIVLIGLHVAGAIKHQFDGDPVLWRMAPWMKRPS